MYFVDFPLAIPKFLWANSSRCRRLDGPSGSRAAMLDMQIAKSETVKPALVMDTVEIQGFSMDFEGFSKVTGVKTFANPRGSAPGLSALRDPAGFAHLPNDMRQLRNWPAPGFLLPAGVAACGERKPDTAIPPSALSFVDYKRRFTSILYTKEDNNDSRKSL